MKNAWSSSRRTVAAILALVVVDLVLVALAFGTARSRTGPDQGAGVPGATTAATPSPRSTTPSSPTSTKGSGTGSATTTPASPVPAPSTRRLVALSGDVAWRATQGSCDGGGGAVSVTTDGGRTWGTASSPARVVLRLLPKSEQTASVVGAGADCTASLFATSSAGSIWAASGGAADSWYREPKDPSRVHTPGAEVVQPCEGQALVVDLVALSTGTAQALCADGAVRTSADRGASWQRSAVVPGALALDARREAAGVTAYVLRVDASCPGLQVVRAGATTEGIGCLQGAAVPATGALALSVNGDNGWVEADDQTWRSTDGLRTWRRP